MAASSDLDGVKAMLIYPAHRFCCRLVIRSRGCGARGSPGGLARSVRVGQSLGLPGPRSESSDEIAAGRLWIPVARLGRDKPGLARPSVHGARSYCRLFGSTS